MSNVVVCPGLAFLQVFYFTFTPPKESGRVHGYRWRLVLGCSKLIFDFVVLNSFESGNFDEMMSFEANFVDLEKSEKKSKFVFRWMVVHMVAPPGSNVVQSTFRTLRC